ncbi:hypothetical protein [Arthrobacter castelli]|uniref:hypothetical protein n=1 Tax=Arthrobacter castelli TaxID=271431 RepID=UPI0012DEDB13|nr:hypothetical protein [Arthrobacter castelli]
MNSRYTKPAARIMLWGVLLFIVGVMASGYLSYMGLVEQVSSPFGRSEAGSFFAAAAASALAGLVGVILAVLGGWRAVSRADQRYEAWFSNDREEVADPQGDPSAQSLPEQVEPLQDPQPVQQQQGYAEQYRIAPPAPQLPPRRDPQS